MWEKERDEDDSPPTWEEFKEAFMANFILEEDKEAKATEFEQVKQGNKSVQEYYIEFIRLAKHFLYMVKTEKTKIRRFVGSLAYHIKDTTSAAGSQCKLGFHGCYHCGDIGHIKANCPKLRRNFSGGSTRHSSSSATAVALPQARGSHNQTGHGTGRGSTFSYVTPYFDINLGLEPEQLSESFLVSTPVGESVKVTRVYRGCIVLVQGRNTKADLIELEMVDLDVIMGMNWLSSCYAMLDCHAKIVMFQFPNEEVLE
ncbi:uncharacterized protein [Nicotiana sylvestris]|uniref:uncharacterized protein n=1 Tax=Nicotiana sylvestris TaxID=4096 RepID=UPI00388CC043